MTPDDDVRRLLAALDEHDRRDPPGLPEDVAARLDAQLASLDRERDQEPTAAPVAAVVPLRRRVRPSLAAAAAVVLVAGGGAAVAGGLLTGGSGNDAASEAGGSEADTPPTAAELAPPERESSDEGTGASDSLRTLRGPLQLQRDDLAGQVRRLVAAGTLRLDPGAAGLRGQSSRVRSAGCVPPDAEGAQLGVSYDVEPATLVVGVADGGVRDVRIYSCSGDQVLGRTQVPADLAPR